MRGIAAISCRPFIEIVVEFPDWSIVSCSILIEGIGLTATRITISSPLDMPARIPPALFVEKPRGVMESLFSEPFMAAALKPEPISTPLTAPMLIRAFARSASSLSNTGSPKPCGIPFARISTTPPIESPSFFTLTTRFSMFSAAAISGQQNMFWSITPRSRFSAFTPPSSIV